jgi:hypothetical protein
MHLVSLVWSMNFLSTLFDFQCFLFIYLIIRMFQDQKVHTTTLSKLLLFSSKVQFSNILHLVK